MKKGNSFANCAFAIFLLIVASFFTACADSSNDEVSTITKTIEQSEIPFSMVLKTINSENKDITTDGDVDGAMLFVFNEDNDFVKQINVDKSSILNRTPIKIECPGTNKITVIAWSGISSNQEEISTLSQANIISDLQVSLKQNNGIASKPSDLFYGKVTLQKNATKTTGTGELIITRKTSIFNLTTQGLVKYMGNTKGEYFYKIQKTKGILDHNGEVTGDEVGYIIPASFDKKGNLVAKSQTVLSSDQVMISLYKDNNLLFSSEKDQNGQILSSQAGKQSDIIFKYANNISTNVLVADWGTIIQNITLN